MRNRIIFGSILVLFLTAVSYAAAPRTLTLEVKNMTCSACKITVRNALEKVAGVTDARVDYEKKTATVQYDPDKTSPEKLTKASADAGFPATVRK